MTTAAQVLEKHWDKRFPVDPSDIAIKAGLEVKCDFGLIAADICGTLEDKLICFHPDLAWVTQRYSIAHSLGHYFLFNSRSNISVREHYSTLTESERNKAANEFALELLLPKKVIDWFVLDKGNRDIIAISEELGVSRTSVLKRLTDLGYVKDKV